MSSAHSVRPRRMTQPERSAATRQALLESTIECLVELGFDRSTTGEISERAGLSRGAHLHHFQTRTALVVAAAQELSRRIAADLEDRIQSLPEGADRVGAALDAVWEVFTGPLFVAVMELALHARTDEELGVQFKPVERAVRRDTGRMLRRAFGREQTDRTLDDAIGMVLATIRGLAILPILDPNTDLTKRWAVCREPLVALVQAAARA